MKGETNFFDDLAVGARGELLVYCTLKNRGFSVNDVTKDKFFQQRDTDFEVFKGEGENCAYTTLEVKNQPEAYFTGNVFLEDMNRMNVKRNGKGWLHYCQAEHICFVQEQINCAHIVSMKELKEKISLARYVKVWDGSGYIMPIKTLMKFDSYYCLTLDTDGESDGE